MVEQRFYTFEHVERGDSSAWRSNDADATLTDAVVAMALNSAWGRWYFAQKVALSAEENRTPSLTAYLRTTVQTAASLVTQAAMDGEIEIRGRSPNNIAYEPTPREAWGWRVYET